MYIIEYFLHLDPGDLARDLPRHIGPFETANDAVAYGGTNDNTWRSWDVFPLRNPEDKDCG
jgi:hypothetical protein